MIRKFTFSCGQLPFGKTMLFELKHGAKKIQSESNKIALNYIDFNWIHTSAHILIIV